MPKIIIEKSYLKNLQQVGELINLPEYLFADGFKQSEPILMRVLEDGSIEFSQTEEGRECVYCHGKTSIFWKRGKDRFIYKSKFCPECGRKLND